MPARTGDGSGAGQSVADAVAALLVAVGVRHVYGLPGEDHLTLLDAMATSGLEYHASFNESSAAVMAATEAQRSGLPGVVVLSMAPGVSNGVNGILNAFMEQVPVLVVSGQHPAAGLPTLVRQNFETAELVRPMVKWIARLTPGSDVVTILGKAIDVARAGTPGPVYVELPDEVARAPWTGADPASVLRRVVTPRPGRGDPSAASEATKRLRDRLSTARRPALVLGGREGRLTPTTARTVAESWRIPVFTTVRRKGTLDGSCPFYAGTFLNGKIETRVLDRCDLVVMVDPEAADIYSRQWPFDAEVVAVAGPSFTEWANRLDEVLVADPEAALGDLGDGASSTSAWSPEEIAAYRSGTRSTLLAAPGPGAFSVGRAVDAALRASGPDARLVADAGFGKPVVALLSEPGGPGRFFASNALSTMGYAIPAALALSGASEDPVVAFVGDGSFLMRATELMAGDLRSPLVVVVLADQSLTQIEIKQERRRLEPVGVQLPALSFAAVGTALGVRSADVEEATALEAHVRQGLGSKGVTLLGAHVEPGPSRSLFEELRG